MSFRKYMNIGVATAAVTLLLVTSAQAGLLNADTGFGTRTAVLDEVTGKTWLSFRVQSGQSFEEFSPLLGTGNYTDFRLASRIEVSQLLNNHTSGFASTDAGISAAFSSFVSLFGPTLRDGLTGTGCELEMTAITADLLPAVQVFPRAIGPGGARPSGSHGIAGFGIVGRTDNSVACSGSARFTNEVVFGGRLSLDALKSRYIISRGAAGFDYQTLYAASGFNPVLPFNDFDLPLSSAGFWLVKNAAVSVPEPSTTWLFGLALLCLAGMGAARRRGAQANQAFQHQCKPT